MQKQIKKKNLVWISRSPCGIFQPFVVPAGLAINKTEYKNDYIIKRLISFINKSDKNTYLPSQEW